MLALIAGSFIWYPRAVALPIGMTAPAQPLQQDLQRPEKWIKGDYTITALARYQLTAKVLGKKSYVDTQTGDIAPYDLALGWGEMSDASVLQSLKITQSDRWFYVYWRHSPISSDQIMQNSANTHILPANEFLARKVQGLKDDQVIFLKGYLVEVSKADGFIWRSSLSRKDTGNGSCEIFWVEDIQVL